ncbi:hypothetical protein, partial [Brevibacillus brevis]|uniref:hypothetical protein n=1 Tax=Brevibacillus brevis TaxID=1393 RepID=UPI0037C65A5D
RTAFFGLNRIIEKERVSFTYTATKSGFLQDSPVRVSVFLLSETQIKNPTHVNGVGNATEQ